MERFLPGVFFMFLLQLACLICCFILQALEAEEKFSSISYSYFCPNSCSAPLAVEPERIVCSNSCSVFVRYSIASSMAAETLRKFNISNKN